MAFTAKDVMALREKTGAGVMDCKKALTDTDGDMEKATDLLRERGIAKAEKKASRIAAEGIVACYIEGSTGVLLEVNCESDFVAKNASFVEFADSIAKQVALTNPADVEALLAEKAIDADGTVLDKVNNATAKIGEKISLRRFTRMEMNGRAETYIHMGGKIGVLLGVETDKDLSGNADFNAACHDIAMHIAAFAPKYSYDAEVPAEEVAHEKEILKAQIKNDPKNASKPDQIIEKMLEGTEIRCNADFFDDRANYLRSCARKIIYTGPVDRFFDYRYGPLEYRTLRFETEVLNTANFQGNAVVNYTSSEVPFTRIIEHKHFEFGRQEKTVISREYPSAWKSGDEPYYPVNDEKNEALYAKYADLARKETSIIFGGRLGTYKYYDMHHVIGRALETVRQEEEEQRK